MIHVGEGAQLKEEAAAAAGKYDLNLVSRNEKAKVAKNYKRKRKGHKKFKEFGIQLV